MTVASYLELVTHQHQCKPRFEATLTAIVEPLCRLQEVLRSMPAAFDVDEATGVQLDAVGVYVGASRRLEVPLTDVYFSWDASPTLGWDAGVWMGPFDPESGLVNLPDDAYRTLLRARVAANSWDGTVPGAIAIWSSVFPSSEIVIQDNQDMTMLVGIAGQPLSTVEQALLSSGVIQLKPAGVRIASYSVVPNAGPLFSWDATPSAALSGWDVGQWAIELTSA